MNTRTRLAWQLLLALGLILMLILGGVGTAAASEIISGDTVTIGSGEVIDDDLVIFANTIVVNGTVNGDLIAFGNTITLNGTVNGSAMFGGQTLTVSGQVKGALYGGGTELRLTPTASIERNMFFGGYSLRTEQGSIIARDLTSGAGQAVLGGRVGRDVQFGGNALELNGEIGRNVRAEVSDPGQPSFFWAPSSNLPPSIASGLRVSQNAKIGGELSYTSSVDQSNEILVTPQGGIRFQQVATSQPATAPTPWWIETLMNRVRDFVTVLILGGLAILALPRWVNASVANAESKPLAATGWGLLVLVAGYVLAILAFFAILMVAILLGFTTLGGLVTAFATVGFSGLLLAFTGFTAFVLWGAKVVVACLIGKLLFKQFVPNSADNLLLTFLVGLVLFEVVAAIPFLGPVVTFVTILLGLGAVWYLWYERRKTVGMTMTKPAPMPA